MLTSNDRTVGDVEIHLGTLTSQINPEKRKSLKSIDIISNRY